MTSIRVASLCLVLSLGVFPSRALAQPSNNLTLINARLTALEATVTALQASLSTEVTARQTADTNLQAGITAETTARTGADTTLTTQVNKLRGIGFTLADLAGTYRIAGTIIDLDANPAAIQAVSITGTVTLAANFTGTLSTTFHGIGIEQGTPWTSSTFGPQTESGNITWSGNLNGTIHVTDGTPNLNLDFNVGAGGRVLTYSGVSDDNTVDLVVLTRLQ